VNVLYFADTRFPIERANGIQTMATCHALASRGHTITLVVRADTSAPPRDPFAFYGLPRVESLTINPIRRAPRMQSYRRLQFLATAWRLTRTHAAVVYTRDLGLAVLLLRAPAGPPVVYESHGIAPVVSAELPRLLGRSDGPSAAKLARLDRRERDVWRRAAAYVTITEALAADLATRYGVRDRLFVVPDGAAPAAPAAPSTGRVVAAYAGHLYPWKGVDVFVRALARAPRVHGLIIGGHPQETDRPRVEALARDVGVADRLEMTGLVPPAEVARHLARAAILVLPNTASSTSDRYTSPLKLFEYLWAGRPIVASDLAAIREVLTHDRTGWLVPAGDEAALAAALERLAADPALGDRLGAAARALAPRYTWQRRAERLEQVLAAAVAR
jgi:glycosyltransferase involved in cell wall biosynthesis